MVALVLLVAAVLVSPRGDRGLDVGAVLLLLGMLVLSGAYLLAAGIGRFFRRRPVLAPVLVCSPLLLAALMIWFAQRAADPGPAQRAGCVDSCAFRGMALILVCLLLSEAVLLTSVVTGFAVHGLAGLGALLVAVGANCVLANQPVPGYLVYAVGALLAGAPWLPGLSRLRWRTHQLYRLPNRRSTRRPRKGAR